MTTLVRVRAIQLVDGRQIVVTFTNDEQRQIDMTPYIAVGTIFAPVRDDPDFFACATVDGGTITWPNGADIDPDVLYAGGIPAWAVPDPVPMEAPEESVA